MRRNILITVLISIFCFSCKSQNQVNTEIVGSWKICVNEVNGVKEHPNHCPEISFFENGDGVFEASDPSSKFQWKIIKDKIYFSFQSSYDKEQFLSKNAELKYEFQNDEKLRLLKLVEETTGNWFLLSHEK